jgi:hypothetical protein
MKKVKLFKRMAFAFGVLASSTGFSQTTINVAGNAATINGITFEYAIGEMTIISTEKTPNLIVTQGFLQPSNLSENTKQATTNKIDPFLQLVKVYPNPTSNLIFIESQEQFNDTFNIQLIDASGKSVLGNDKATNVSPQKRSIDLGQLASGSYFLIISLKNIEGEQHTTSFKIQKTN